MNLEWKELFYENMKFEDESSCEQRLRMALSLNTQT